MAKWSATRRARHNYRKYEKPKTKRGKSFYSKKHRSRGYYIYDNDKKVGFIKQKSRRYR